MKIIKAKRDPNRLTLQEIGLLTYIERHLDIDGLFGQRQSVTAEDVQSSQPTIHRIIHSLIDKGHLTVVRTPVRGEDGWMTELVVKPNSQVYQDSKPNSQVNIVENKRKPNPHGLLEAMSIGKQVSRSELYMSNRSAGKHAGMLPGDDVNQAHVPTFTLCADSDCTNTPDPGSAYCYRHRDQVEMAVPLEEL